MARQDSPGKYRNQLLRALAVEDLARLEPHLKSVALALRTPLEQPNRSVADLYFLEEGIASVVVVTTPASKGEVGLVGREGVSGLCVLLGDNRTPHSVYMQLSGKGFRIEADVMRMALEQSTSLRTLFLRYAHSFVLQLSHTAAANVNAPVERRLARWLLMAHDRIGNNEITLTHEFLGLMIGTRRAGVTEAVRALAKRGLIRATRGNILLLDRRGLETQAGRFYGIAEAEYRRLIG
ncbi:MAG TPA: Crp/Fnr family transcriptional regulator [Rhizomicrobium sp.]|nr:Crp/Fnr family transcriptional regulator [Rhizomicrobium sp.]